MPARRFVLRTGAGLFAGLCCGVRAQEGTQAGASGRFAVNFTEEEWRKRLTARQYAVLRQHGTERPYSSALNKEQRRGVFVCAGCGAELFSSAAKYDSRTGWPSFWMPLAQSAVGQRRDTAYGMVRTEIHCARCGGHLGHVFNDGPPPTGLRYCMNGDAMLFRPATAAD